MHHQKRTYHSLYRYLHAMLPAWLDMESVKVRHFLRARARAHWLRLIVGAWSREEPAVLDQWGTWDVTDMRRRYTPVIWVWQLLTRPWRAFLKEENVNASYANNLYQMFKLPSDHWQIKCESTAHPRRSRLIFKRLEVVRSLPPQDEFNPSENQATKKWKRVITGGSNNWCITHSALSFVTKWCSREGCHLQKSPDNDFTPSFFGRH